MDPLFDQLVKTSCIVYVSGLSGLGDGFASSGDSTSAMDNFFDVSGVLAVLQLINAPKKCEKVWL